MGKKVFDRDNWVVLLDGRMMIDQLMDREGVHPEFESLWGRIPPRTESDDEYHQKEEVNIVYSGSFIIEVGDQSYSVKPGDVITIPSNIRHKVVNASDEEGVWICLLWDAKEEGAL
ncbi:cupin domain-containing protein [Diplocloster modestus]|uniref:Cupin domain-containing protein n=1 Tax=Diplocloster modestus TaxID=2850322 RepID=A0ABS6KBI2_9FIRM|nr:cupin domain-containing protein [Diplocloster modestus]MBU9727857.1 cupin domain-containing protein [Diplocloster modestus]